MREVDVRTAVKSQVLRRHAAQPETLIIDELGLRHGEVRVDIAVVNGALHGYELKSQADNLERLPKQVEIYGSVLDYATLVVAERHLEHGRELLPEWWGVRVVRPRPRRGFEIVTLRRAACNPNVSPVALAELLWRDEVVMALQDLDHRGATLRQPRANLYALLAEAMPLDDLKALVRRLLKHRSDWRVAQRPSKCAGYSRPTPML